MKTLKFKEYQKLNENLNPVFLEPTRKNIKSFGLDYSKVKHNEDGSIDYDGNVLLSQKNLKQIPFNFNHVKGIFSCSYNQLTSLYGAPQHVDKDFNCEVNEILSLQYAPKVVGGNFNCNNNKLTSLMYLPWIGKNFDCSTNNLTSLKYCPTSVSGTFRCRGNRLTNLKYCPVVVGEYFDCSSNNIIILKNYEQDYIYDDISDNPILINKTEKVFHPDWTDKKTQKRFKDGLPYVWDEIETQEDFGKIMEKIIELEMEMKYSKEIIKYSNKFNLDLLKYLPPNIIRAMKSQFGTIDDIGWSF